MKKNRINYTEVICHILFWVIPTYLILRYDLMALGDLRGKYISLPIVVSTVLNILLVYFNILYMFPAYKAKKLSNAKYILVIFSSIVLVSIFKLISDGLFNLYYFSRLSSEVPVEGRIYLALLTTGFFCIQSILYSIVKEWIRNNKIRKKLLEEKNALQLKYLKAQINPHFLYNSLNNLYSMSLKNNDYETATGIATLSQLMRFMLDDANESLISLSKEIDYLNSYIELQRLRFSETDDIKITFNVNGETDNVFIPPMIFVVFIENAFKYGINFKKHSFIDINFLIDTEALKFTISNSIHYKNAKEVRGIGLKNVTERLDLLYNNNYILEIDEISNNFNVVLEIKKQCLK